MATEELKAILAIYDESSSILAIQGRGVLFQSNEQATSKIIQRAAFTRYAGQIIGEWATVQGEKFVECGKMELDGFKVIDLSGLGLERRVGEWIKDLCKGRVDLENPKTIVVLMPFKDKIIIFTSEKMPNKGFWERKKNRVFFEISALHPQLARFMVNLSMVREGDLLLDPFAGSMSIPIEAVSVGAYAVGGELDAEAVFGGTKNLRLGDGKWDVLRADALHPPFAPNSFSSIATDPPFGRLKKIIGQDKKESFFSAFLIDAGQLLKPRGGLSFLLPQDLDPEILPWRTAGIELLGVVPMRVHKSFIRYALRCRKTV